MFVKARSICLKSIDFLAIVDEVSPSRAEIEAIWVATKKAKDIVGFIFWWRGTNKRVGCEWRGRGLVRVVMRVRSSVGMEGVAFIEVVLGCTKRKITHGAWCRSQSLYPTWRWSEKYVTRVLQLFLWVGVFYSRSVTVDRDRRGSYVSVNLV